MKITIKFKYCSLFLLIACIAFSTTEIAAYQMPGMYVQYRAYADGTKLNKLWFEIKDDEGNYIPNIDAVTNVKLYDPNGSVVNLSDILTEDDLDLIYGSYDCNNGNWDFNESILINDYYAEILDPLIQGTYRLEVTTDDGQTHERTFEFYQQIDLPIVSSGSFQLHPDTYGNVYWTWKISGELLRISETHNIHAEAAVYIYSNQQYVGVLWVRLPAHIGRLFIPNSVVQELANMGDEFGFRIYTRTSDKNNRSLSSVLTVDDLLSYYPSNSRQPVNDFVTRFYQQCLNRDPDQNGLDYWVEALMDGSKTGADVARGFALSTEFVNRETTNTQFLTIFYSAFFNRDPDDGGLSSWLTQLNAGTSREDVLNGFIYAQEFDNLCGDYGITPN